MAVRSYRVLGDVWQVPLRLDAPEALAPSEPVVTVDLLIDEGIGLRRAPHESSWLAGAFLDGNGYALFRCESGIAAWYPRLGVAHFSADLRSIQIHAERGTEATWALLLAASIPAQRALLLGDLCLHASAFDRNGEAVLLIGPSGSGKSTLVACAVEHGFTPLADDAVRVGWSSARAEFVAGSSSLRLRAGAVARFATGAEWVSTVDGRMARSFDAAAPRPLASVVLLRPNAPSCELSEVSPAAALTRLVAVGDRVLAVRERQLVCARFARWAALVRSCDVLELGFPSSGTPSNIDATLRTLIAGL